MSLAGYAQISVSGESKVQKFNFLKQYRNFYFFRWRYRYRDMSFMAYSYLDNDIFLTSLNETHLMPGEIRTNLVEHYQRSIQEYQRWTYLYWVILPRVHQYLEYQCRKVDLLLICHRIESIFQSSIQRKLKIQERKDF